MKILLDECIPRKLKYSLSDHECHTVPEAGLAAEPYGQEHRESDPWQQVESAGGSSSIAAQTS
jgi:hypothetical protein